MGAEAARVPVGLNLIEMHEAHQVQRGGCIARGKGTGHDLERTGCANRIEQRCGFSLPGGGAPRERYNRRMERNSIRH